MKLPQNLLDILKPVRLFAEALIDQDLIALEAMVPNWDVCGNAVIEIVKDYPDRLIRPPEEAYSAISYTLEEDELECLPAGLNFPMIYIYELDPDEWHIDLFFWTEKGLGDLAAVLLIKDTPAGKSLVELQDLRVP